jgi:hypothetical protein
MKIGDVRLDNLNKEMYKKDKPKTKPKTKPYGGKK